MTCTGKTVGQNPEEGAGRIAYNRRYLERFGVRGRRSSIPRQSHPHGRFHRRADGQHRRGRRRDQAFGHRARNAPPHRSARVFDDEIAARSAVTSGAIQEGDVLVIR